MKKGKSSCVRIGLALKVVGILALSAALFLIVYRYDNKYTVPGPKAKDGVLALNNESLEAHPVLFLVDGWEYYGGRLLAPEDFEGDAPTPDQYMFIGRFGGFERWNSGSPHGSASYRLNIQIPEEPAVYLLELPEIFSAYRLYINGRQVIQMGDPSPDQYRPEIANRSISIEVGGNIEILFAVSDYSHLYSGMVYPPAFGEPEAVFELLSARLVFRSLLCAVALTVGGLSVMVGLLSRRNSLALLFGLLCLFFVGYVSYPITGTLLTGSRLQYALENVSFCAMLGITMLTAMQVSGLPKKWGLPFVSFGGLMCAASVALHLLLPLGNLQTMLGYSRLISAYEWIAVGFIGAAVWYAIRKGVSHVTPLLYGVVIFTCALMTDRLLPVYEPIFIGWFIEVASFALVLCIGVATGQEVVAKYRESAVLAERANSMERLYKSQLSYFETLKQEMEQTKTLRHNLRHQLVMMDEYLQNGQYDKLEAYMKEYRVVSTGGQLREYCPIDVINTLTHHYHEAAKRSHIHFEFRCDLKVATDPSGTGMTDLDLCCLYANLMENAVEACQRISAGCTLIRVGVFRISPDILCIRVWNSAENICWNGKRFLSSKKNGQTGYGLLSVEAIAEKYGGKAEFRWDEVKKEFESKVTMMA